MVHPLMMKIWLLAVTVFLCVCFLVFIDLHHWAHGKFGKVTLETSEDRTILQNQHERLCLAVSRSQSCYLVCISITVFFIYPFFLVTVV